MRNIFRVIGFGLAVFIVTASNAAMSYAQANPCEDSFEIKNGEFEKFKTNIGSPVTLEKAKMALKIGTDYTTKYKDCDDTKDVVAYMNKKIPVIQNYITETERNNRFNNGVKNKVFADAFGAGKEIIAAKNDKSDSLDVALVLASLGFDEAVKKNDSYNNDAIEMSRLAIQKLESGVTSDKFGLFGIYEYKTKDYPDGKANALGWMNYVIGYITYIRQDKKKDALPYLYTALTKYNSATKNFPEIYEMIGAYYYAELVKIDEQRTKLIAANDNKDNDETLAMWAMELGYLDRTIDANARVYKIASAQSQTDNKTRIYAKLQDLYKDRFKKTEGLDAYIATLTSKPMVDPVTPVEPVKEEKPVTTTATTTTTTTTTTNSTTKPTTTTNSTTTNSTTTKPTTTNPTTTTKPTTNSTTTTKPSTSTTKPKSAVKKKRGR